MTLLLGAHVSIAKSLDLAIDRALALKCDTFQIFTRNPRGWKYIPLKDSEINAFKEKLKKSNLKFPTAHMPYLPNLSSPNEETYKRSLESLILELERCGQLGIPYLVIHLGSHMGSGVEMGIKRIINACNEALEKVKNDTMILLENTAGQKNSVGALFEHLKEIIKGIKQEDRVMVCFDTCHALVSGYEIRNEKAINDVMSEFDRIIGLDRLKVVHINDSKGDIGSHLDRHEHIGLGYIGEKGFEAILKNDVIRKLPLILETPEDEKGGYERDLAKVRELAKI
ncbi:putative endonuclease 4 [archaeon HR06]|nr:putative endonuclease 4 [archaeon HR06]